MSYDEFALGGNLDEELIDMDDTEEEEEEEETDPDEEEGEEM